MIKNIFWASFLKGNQHLRLNVISLFHSSEVVNGVKNFKAYNDKIYPPQAPDEPRRPAFVCHVKENIKYSPKKLWYIACLVRGMTVDEALKQLQFVQKKGAVVIRETILEAQKMAVEEHNVEYKTNLWVSESFVGKAIVIKGLRRAAKGRMCKIRYRYSHYFVTLEEGTPPKDYYYFNRQKSGEELLSEWLTNFRKRKIKKTL